MSEHTEDRMVSLCVQSEGSVIARVGGKVSSGPLAMFSETLGLKNICLGLGQSKVRVYAGIITWCFISIEGLSETSHMLGPRFKFNTT